MASTTAPGWFLWVLRAWMAYAFALSVLAVALIGALLGGAIDPWLAMLLPDLWQPGWGRHGGWLLFLGAAVVAQIAGRGRLTRWAEWKEVDPRATKQQSESRGRPARIVPAAFFFTLVGTFLGFLLGGSLLVMWFSLSLSPWPPQTWAVSYEPGLPAEDPRGLAREPATVGISTSDPAALALVGIPALVLGLAGMVLGAVGAAKGWITDETNKPRRRRQAIEEEPIHWEPCTPLPRLAPPPRPVPWRAWVSQVEWLWGAVGAAFLVAGVAWVVAAVVVALNDRSLVQALAFVGISLPFCAVGIYALYHAARRARSAWRALRHGQLAHALLVECRDGLHGRRRRGRWRKFQEAFDQLHGGWDEQPSVDTQSMRRFLTVAGVFALLVFAVMGAGGLVVTVMSVILLAKEREPIGWFMLLFILAWWALLIGMGRLFYRQIEAFRGSDKWSAKSLGIKPIAECRAQFMSSDGKVVEFETKLDLADRLETGEARPEDIAIYDPRQPEEAFLLGSFSPPLFVSSSRQWQQQSTRRPPR